MALTRIKPLAKATPRSNPIVEYYTAINSGAIVVSKKVRKQVNRLMADIHNPRRPWIYDKNRAWHAIDFIERFCRHSKGRWGGQLVKLELWQKAFVAAAFGFIHNETGLRRFTKVILFVARKNGKSTLAAAIGLYLMVMDGEPGAEVYSVATKYDQAKIVWLEAKRMIKKSPELRKRIKTLVAELQGPDDSIFKALGSDSDTLDGLNVHGALMDEVHAWKEQNLFDVIADGMTARDEPFLLETSTTGTVREGVFDVEYDYASNVLNDVEGFEDDRILSFIYELDERKEWTDPVCWPKANPGLGTIKDGSKLADKVARAKRIPSAVKNLLCKDFNVRETTSDAWLPFEVIDNPATFDVIALKPRYGIGGADLSQTTDLTAAKVIFMVPGDDTIYVLQMYWMPEDLIEKRTLEDKVPYDKWVERKLLRPTPGNKVHHTYVTEWFLEMRDKYDIYIPWIGYDAWSAEYWVEEMRGHFGPASMFSVHQGPKTLSLPMGALGADLDKKRINYNAHPIDRWCLSNTCTITDTNGNIKPDKGRKTRRRIDGTAALLNAYTVLLDHQMEYQNMM